MATCVEITKPPGTGWVELPVRTYRRGVASTVRGTDPELVDWSVEAARELAGPDPDPDLVADYAEQLAKRTVLSRERGEIAQLVWFPEPGGPPAAEIHATWLIHRGSGKPKGGGNPLVTLDRLEEMAAKPRESTAELEVSRVELGCGPAIRTRQVEVFGETTGDAIVQIEFQIPWSRLKNALIMNMFWVLADDDPALVKIADNTAETLRIG